MELRDMIDAMSIEHLNLPTRVRNSLQCCGNIETIGELRSKTPAELRKLPYIGKKGIATIEDSLQSPGPPPR